MTTAGSQAQGAWRKQNMMDGRSGFRLRADWGYVSVLDRFGPPSPEETTAGLTTHGEAPALKWDAQKYAKSPKPDLQYGLTLPEARIRFSRKLTLDPRNPVIYCEEEKTTLCLGRLVMCPGSSIEVFLH